MMINIVVIVMGLLHYWDAMRGDAKTYSTWRDRFSLPIHKIEFGNGFANLDFTEMPFQDMVHGSGFSPYRYFSVGFQERRMQTRHVGLTVMIRVMQRQHGGSFLRLSWDLGISLLDNSATNTETRVGFCFHEIGSLAEQFFEGLIELLQYRVALLSDNIQQVSYVRTLPDHALSGGCFTSSRVVSDPRIIFSFSLLSRWSVKL
jgi:hypothetical protein